MNRTVLLTLTIYLFLLIAGCSEGSSTTASVTVGNTSGQGATGAADSGQNLLALQLALGTLKLEESEYPVSAEQATYLLPLWKAARSLGENDVSSTQEMNALLNQIKDSMTDEQWKVIKAMGSSTQDLAVIAQELGTEIGSTGPTGSPVLGSGSSSAQAPAGGDMSIVAGGPPDGGPPDAGVSPSSGASSQASQSLTGGGGTFMGLSDTLLDSVITLLKEKT